MGQNLFLSAPLETRIKRIMQKLNVTSKEAEQQIRKEDKRRADNYRYYTGRMWGMSASFDLALNTELGMEYIEEVHTEGFINILYDIKNREEIQLHRFLPDFYLINYFLHRRIKLLSGETSFHALIQCSNKNCRYRQT